MSRTDDWCECATGCWDVWWLWRKPRPKDDAWFITQRVNHIPKTATLTHKDQLKSALQRYSGGRGSGAHLFELMPLTFNLPKDYVAFAQTFAERRGLWIMKTVGMSRGRGISIVSDISDVSYSAPVVVQEYVRDPLLINGHKFDLRLYVCVTQFDPLEAFISSIGFARFATSTYTESAASLSDLSVHLTNTSVSEKVSAGGTSKWSLEALAASGVIEDWAGVWGRVRGAVLRTLVAVEDRIPRCEAAFELFGFDVILDSSFRPWVLEVNASPSMELFGRLDEQLKPDMVCDVLELVGGPSIDRGRLKELMSSVTKTGAYVGKRAWGEAVAAIFNGRLPRAFGDPAPAGSSFESIAPSLDYDRAVRAKRSAV
jgi:tubulin polyglutamylase TTLL5